MRKTRQYQRKCSLKNLSLPTGTAEGTPFGYYTLPGLILAIFGLASYLWMRQYRERHFPTAPVSHA